MARMVETVILRNPNSGAPEALPAGSEVPEWAVDMIGSKELIEGGGESREQKLEDLTNAALKELAEERDIDLGGATKKADIIAAIESAMADAETDADVEPDEDPSQEPSSDDE